MTQETRLLSAGRAEVLLSGEYTLDGDRLDFEGKMRTDAKVSQMVASKWKSLLLKPVDPFFKKDGAGAVIPVKVTGTKSAPKFGLDLHRKEEKKVEEKLGKAKGSAN
jgi:hypothetical protein